MADPIRCGVCGAHVGNTAGRLCSACLLRTAMEVMVDEPDGIRVRGGCIGPYELLGEIARGGMGIVYRARQPSLQRLVALKVIQGAAFATPEMLRRFRVEAELAAGLDHPHIVRIYEIGEHEGRPYFSMGLVEGETLAEAMARAVKRRTGVPAEKRLRGAGEGHCREMAILVAKVARAVHYAHQRGVLHRDLKPTNVLIDGRGEPRLTDFGLAKLAYADSSLTHTNAILGTPSFMAPEQARGDARHVTVAADVYGLGALLYSAITGSPPFAGTTPLETLHQVLEQEPRPPSQLEPTVDRDLETVCLRCLAKEPSRRYASASDVADDLDRWLRREPIRARPTGRWERVGMLLRRRPLASAMAIGFGLSVVVGMLAVLWQWRRAERERLEAVAARAEARRESYFAGIALAQRQLEEGDVTRARERLAALPSEFRHWEWGHLMALCHQDFARFQAGASGPARVAWSPDGTRLATVAGSQARMWRMPEATEQASVAMAVDPRVAPVFVLGGSQLALVVSNSIRLVDRDSGVGTESIGLPSVPLMLEATPSGDRLLTLHTGGRAVIRGLPGGRELGVVDSVPPLVSAKFSSDGRHVLGQVLAPEGMGLRVFDGFTGRLLRDVLSVTNGAEQAVFDGYGNHYAWRAKQHVHVGGAPWPKESLPLMGPAPVAIALSPEGRFLLVSEFAGTTRGWDLMQQRPAFTTSERVDAVEFSPDGRHASIWGGGSGTAILDLQTGEVLRRLQGRDRTGQQQRFSPDGRLLATSARDGSVQLWSARPGRSRLDDDDLLRRLAISPDGRWGVTVFISGGITVWEISSGRPVCFPAGHLQWVLCVAFGPGGGVFATGAADRTARLWDVRSGAELRCLPHDATVSALAFSGDRSRLVTGDRHGGLHLWDLESGAVVAKAAPGHGAVIDLAVAGDTVAVAFADGTVALWTLTGFQLRRELGRHSDQALTVAFSPDGSTLASTGRDRRLWLWDLSSGRMTQSAATRNQVYRMAFSPDGARLATGSSAERGGFDYPSLEIWEAATARQIVGFRYDNGQIHSVCFSPDGRSIFGGHARQVGARYVFQRETFPWNTNGIRAESSTASEAWAESFARHYWRERLTQEGQPAAMRPLAVPLPRTQWPTRPTHVPPACLDLTLHYNAMLRVPWRTLGVWSDFDDDLASLAVGVHEFGGVPFDVRGLVVAPPEEPEWRRLRFYSTPVEPIAVNRRVRRLHFLQATTLRVPEGTVTGQYVVRYADGSSRELPLVYGENTRSWHESTAEPSVTATAQSVWRGTNATATALGANLRLLLWTWTHPDPDRPIARLSLHSAPRVNAAPFVVAITAD